MSERAIRFGTSAPLAGVLSEPAADSGLPGVVLLNSGILHHAGASRIHVQLARALAAAGFPSLRFDFSGIGDSEVRRDTLPFRESAVAESRDAMDYLARMRGVDRFILIGLCSGADMGYHVSVADERVVGLAQLDAWAYRTRGWYVRHYGRRARSADAWKNVGRRVARRLRPATEPAEGSAAAADSTYIAPEYRRRLPPKADVVAGLRTLVERDVRLLYIFSGGQENYNHHGQFRAAFGEVPFGDLLRVEYVPAADHTFTGLEHQRFVEDTTLDWSTRHFGTPSREEPRGATLAAVAG